MYLNKTKRGMNQLITIWRKDLNNLDRFGNPNLKPPVYAYVRYEENTRLFVTNNVDEIRGKGYIFCTTDVLDENDIVALGKIAATVPTTDSVIVKDRRRVTNMRGNKIEYRYGF